MAKSRSKIVTSSAVATYACGLRAGQVVALRRDLAITSAGGPTGKVHPRGERWTVLPGASEDPGVVWFRQADGHRHTWDDTPALFDWFEVVDSPGGVAS